MNQQAQKGYMHGASAACMCTHQGACTGKDKTFKNDKTRISHLIKIIARTKLFNLLAENQSGKLVFLL